MVAESKLDEMEMMITVIMNCMKQITCTCVGLCVYLIQKDVYKRQLSGPININCDHSDSMGARDAGWIQIYAENNQEAYDNMVQAFRISEHKDVRLPIMICQDGFITSHAVENIELLEDADVKNFVGEMCIRDRSTCNE